MYMFYDEDSFDYRIKLCSKYYGEGRFIREFDTKEELKTVITNEFFSAVSDVEIDRLWELSQKLEEKL